VSLRAGGRPLARFEDVLKVLLHDLRKVHRPPKHRVLRFQSLAADDTGYVQPAVRSRWMQTALRHVTEKGLQ